MSLFRTSVTTPQEIERYIEAWRRSRTCRSEREVSVTTDSETVLDAVSQIDAGPLNVGYLSTAAGHRAVVPYRRGFGTTRFLSNETVCNGEQAALALDARSQAVALDVDAWASVFVGW